MDNKEETTTKKTFVSPKLTVHGDVEVITLGFKNGNFTDKIFPQNTPKNQITFS